jgi:branched-chain amino acid transport system ATP-binding protein
VLEVFRLIATLKERGTSILLVEQNVKQALAIADRAYVLELGRIKAEGRASEIASQVDILGSYLGTKVAPGGQQKEGER